MSEKQIWHRRDITPEEDEREFESFEYADPENLRFPINTAVQILASWRDVNSKENASRYSEDDLQLMKDRIITAAQEHDIENQLGEQLPTHYFYRTGR
jgi:hypothetical protein